MEKKLDVNEIFKCKITKITNSLLPPDFQGDSRSIRDYNISHRLMQDSLSTVIDRVGLLSAAEQGLNKVITTAEKLRTADSHTLYLIKDASARDGKGEVVGLLKVGRKHLFLFDEKESMREVEPLCVLDFFVMRDCQRRGLGKTLFDHMLEDMQTSVHCLAVDAPSAKMEAFLGKNYGLTRLVRHNNNFAVSPQFFDALAGVGRNSGDAAANLPTPSGAVGRYTAPKPESSIANVIHGAVPFDFKG